MRIGIIILVLLFGLNLAGCTFIFQKGRRSDIERIEDLSQQLDELRHAKGLLEESMSKEIGDNQVSLKLMDKGLVITFLADVLFDSGKAKVKQDATPILDKVARILNENVADLDVGIEGHTDNVPIKSSGWKTNWELSTARALSVLHYLSDNKGVSASRLSAIGYGEYRPVASNGTSYGRHKNRRVEIVILPPVTKIKDSTARETEVPQPQENLK